MGKFSTTMEKVRGKRDWVKNAIIIFLVVMLILTFFSNTIMNYSLPEVAAQYPQSTTITTKIRGSGVVEAAQSYNVIVEETRTVASVNVKAGDPVAAGDTLLTLDETESQELADARIAYAAVKLEYEKMLIDAGDQNAAAQAALAQAQSAVTSAAADLSAARTYEANLKNYQDAEAGAKSNLSAKTQAKETAQALVDSLSGQANLDSIANSNAGYLSAKAYAESLSPEDESYAAAQQEVQRIYDEEIAPRLASLTQQLIAAQQALTDAALAESQAAAAYTAAQDATSQYQSNNASGATSVSAAEDALESAQDALTSATAAAADAAQQKNYEDQIALKDQEAKAEEVKRAEETVLALEEKTAAAKVVSRYAGVVKEVNIAAGDTTSAETALVVVELTEKGYTLTATVTKDQARTLRQGLEAEITNLWNSTLTMTLTSITADRNDPSNSRTLTFAVQGEDVTVGQQLNFSVGDKNASYDVVIPSSAIHMDADGSFVYTVVVKSSPLGNRYTVKKTTVTVLASDDVSSAVTGDLSTADFVITTATVPISPGDQVRIAQ